MKKFFVFICFLMVVSSSFAQKSYVNVTWEGVDIYLSGDLPSGMKQSYQYGPSISIGDILNMLSAKGYEVEFMCSNEKGVYYLLSKNSSSSYSSVRSMQTNNEAVTEIARYNLQGIPVKEYDKGIQIIVYSNYTTKTIIVE